MISNIKNELTNPYKNCVYILGAYKLFKLKPFIKSKFKYGAESWKTLNIFLKT